MTLQNDLIKVNEQIAAKRTSLKFLYEGVDQLEGSARDVRASSIKSATSEIHKLIDEHERLTDQHNLEKLERDAVKAARYNVTRQVDPGEDSDDWSGSGSMSTPRPVGPSWGMAVVKAAEEQAGMRGLKAMLPSGTAVVEVPIGGPIENPRRAKFLSELLPAKDAPGGNFSYLLQSVRDNNAAVVAEGALKPTSIFSLAKIEESTSVIAHLSENLPRTYFEDSDRIVQFIEAEMRLGINLALDAKIVNDILAAPGILSEGDIGTTLDTTRRSITRLQVREVEPTAFVFHPRDWEQIELEMTAAWSGNSNVPAPTDEVRRSLFGIPVVVSNAMTENTGLLGDFRGSAALYKTGGVRLDWSEAAAELFQYNLMQFRAEGRFGVAVYRPFAFVEINLAGTGS